MSQTIVIIGGGAAGYFSAINIAEKQPNAKVIILEKSEQGLGKVKVSGGGRCNVTNARTNPAELTTFYPRGNKKLHPLFKDFGTKEMVEWLSLRGVETHAEADQRVFPVTNTSQTIVDCFVNETYRLGIKVRYSCSVKGLSQSAQGWIIATNQENIQADKVVFATGSSPAGLKILGELGLEITPLAPSLFTFDIRDARLHDLPGVSFASAKVKVVKSKLEESGPMIITHWGLSGPAILKLSAWGALELQETKYKFQILINFVPELSQAEVNKTISDLKQTNPNRKTQGHPLFGIPRRFWERLCEVSEITGEHLNTDLSKKHINKLTEELCQGRYEVKGKSTFKEEFVTCGGVDLKEIDLKTFECRRFPNLYLVGEVLNIDAVTGGFNFQACWSGGWTVSEAV